MKTLFSKKKSAVILLLCMMLSVMGPVETASAMYYQYGATYQTYSKTATFMKLGKKYRTKKAGFHYYKLEIPINVKATLTVNDHSNGSTYVDVYRYDGAYVTRVIGDYGWKRANGYYRQTRKVELTKGTTYFRVQKRSDRLATFKISFDDFNN